MNEYSELIAEELKVILEKLRANLFTVMSGKVVPGSLNDEEKTVSVVLSINEADQPTTDVLLNAVTVNGMGMILYPADGSDVWVTEIDGRGKYGIVKCSDLKKIEIQASTLIQLNDGSLGGLPITSNLVGKINAIENLINNLKSAVTLAALAGTLADAGALKTAILAGLGSGILPITVDADIENVNIKQG